MKVNDLSPVMAEEGETSEFDLCLSLGQLICGWRESEYLCAVDGVMERPTLTQSDSPFSREVRER